MHLRPQPAHQHSWTRAAWGPQVGCLLPNSWSSQSFVFGKNIFGSVDRKKHIPSYSQAEETFWSRPHPSWQWVSAAQLDPYDPLHIAAHFQNILCLAGP